jgi:truncated hemoglobin YjbI
MSRDAMIGFFFDGKNPVEIAQGQMRFLLRAMGASPTYAGKPPAQAHTQLAPILTGHFDRRLQILEQTLTDHHLSPEDVQIWLSFENAFRDGIVQK